MFIELILSLLVATPLAFGLAAVLEWRAPARRNARHKSILGFLLPSWITTWAASAWLTQSSHTTWGSIWLTIGLLTLGVAVLLATIASPPAPRRREVRRARRRGELVDPVFVFYSFAMLVAALAAIVTHETWA